MRHSIVATLLLTVGLLLTSMVAPIRSANAQDLPTASEERATLRAAGFPDSSDMATGWNLSIASSFPASGSVPFEYHEATYANRYGSRVNIGALMYDRASEDDALELAAFVIDEQRGFLVESESAPSTRELRELPDPDGCAVVDRATGEEPLMYFFVGSVLCQDTTNDRVILVTVSGNYDGDTFQDAAEAVLEIVLETEPR